MWAHDHTSTQPGHQQPMANGSGPGQPDPGQWVRATSLIEY